MLWEFFKRYTFEVLLGTVIVIVAGLVFITWRIKKVEDPVLEELLGTSIFAFGTCWFLLVYS